MARARRSLATTSMGEADGAAVALEAAAYRAADAADPLPLQNKEYNEREYWNRRFAAESQYDW